MDACIDPAGGLSLPVAGTPDLPKRYPMSQTGASHGEGGFRLGFQRDDVLSFARDLREEVPAITQEWIATLPNRGAYFPAASTGSRVWRAIVLAWVSVNHTLPSGPAAMPSSCR